MPITLNLPCLSSMIGLIVLPVPQLPTNWVETFVAVRWPCSLPHEPINRIPPGAVGELHAAPAANATRPSNPRVFMRALLPAARGVAGFMPWTVRYNPAGAGQKCWMPGEKFVD